MKKKTHKVELWLPNLRCNKPFFPKESVNTQGIYYPKLSGRPFSYPTLWSLPRKCQNKALRVFVGTTFLLFFFSEILEAGDGPQMGVGLHHVKTEL